MQAESQSIAVALSETPPLTTRRIYMPMENFRPRRQGPLDCRRACRTGWKSPDTDYPLVLTTGRSKYHWHTMTRTAKNAALRKSAPDPVLDLHRADARRYDIHDADLSKLRRAAAR